MLNNSTSLGGLNDLQRRFMCRQPVFAGLCPSSCETWDPRSGETAVDDHCALTTHVAALTAPAGAQDGRCIDDGIEVDDGDGDIDFDQTALDGYVETELARSNQSEVWTQDECFANCNAVVHELGDEAFCRSVFVGRQVTHKLTSLLCSFHPFISEAQRCSRKQQHRQ